MAANHLRDLHYLQMRMVEVFCFLQNYWNMESRGTTSFAWHSEQPDAVLEILESGSEGLSLDDANRRLKDVGPNELPRTSGPTVLDLLWRQINDPLIYVLLAAATLALLMGKFTDSAVVFGVVILNMIIGFIQEYRASRAIEALIHLVPEEALVVRNGEQFSLPAHDLVPGDIIVLQPGDRVPADVRVLYARSLRVDEASLTGESEPVDKTDRPVDTQVVLGDRTCMAFGGTTVTAGTGSAIVVETGSRTELGRISTMLGSTTAIETPLTRQMADVGKKLTIGIGIVSVALMLVGLLRGETVVDALLAAITLAVAAIPEGLPAIITIALAIGVQRMAGRRAIIRKLPAVETLGSTTVICTDKTGTLTRGEMSVRSIWTDGEGLIDVEGSGYTPEGRLCVDGEPLRHGISDEIEDLMIAGVLCNDSTLKEQEGSWQITGDPTEAALLVSAAKAGLDAKDVRTRFPRVDAVPFDSSLQYMTTLHSSSENDERMLLIMKGAPEVVTRVVNFESSQARGEVLAEAAKMAEQGLRVLAFACRTFKGETSLSADLLDGGFTFLGLQAMSDPLRPESADAVARCMRAGIEVKMITGDHRATARAIGKEVGLHLDHRPVYSGEELEAMSEEELETAARESRIFARVAPEHKLRLVRALQRQNNVVAMTGDGVNDAPALKQANIGVAMGRSGTAVAKESADMVLADDNFSSIAAAVEEGRRVYDNLVKSLAFVLPTNIGEALIILVAVAFFPVVGGAILMPMLPVQVLWINLVATVALALPLAFEAMEPGLMRRRPRDPRESVLNRFVMFRTLVVAILMTIGGIALFLLEHNTMLAAGATPELALAVAQTTAVTTVILFQIFYLIQCRTLHDSVFRIGLWTNPYVFAGIVLLLVLQAGFVYIPSMNSLFSSAPLGWEQWLRATLVAVAVLPVITIEKTIRRKQARRAREVHVEAFGRARLPHDEHVSEPAGID